MLCRRKQKNPKSLTSGVDNVDTETPAVADRSFDESGSVSGDDSKDISELVKVEINNSNDDISADENNDNIHINTNLRYVQQTLNLILQTKVE